MMVMDFYGNKINDDDGVYNAATVGQKGHKEGLEQRVVGQSEQQ